MNGYYSQLHLLEDSLIQEDGRSLGLDINKKFFEAWQKESESTLIFLQENGKAITTDGTKLRVDMPSKLLLDLRNGYNIGKLVSLDYNQKKKDGYLVAIPCQDQHRRQLRNDHDDERQPYLRGFQHARKAV